MTYMSRFLMIGFGLLIVFSCSSKHSDVEEVISRCKEGVDSFGFDVSKPFSAIKYSQDYRLGIYTYVNDRISLVSGELKGKPFGGVFYFSKGGSLDKYEFVISDVNTYLVDTKNNQEVTELGSPLVSYGFFNVFGTDSLLCRVLFAMYPRDSLQVEYRINKGVATKIALERGRSVPLTKVGGFSMHRKDTVFVKIDASNCLVRNAKVEKSRAFNDTLYFEERLLIKE